MSKRKVHPKGVTWHEAVHIAEAEGFLDNLEQLDETAYAATFPEGNLAAARELARQLPGQVQTSLMSMAGVSWINGTGGPHGCVIRRENIPNVQEARGVCTGILGAGTALPWSVGACARRLLMWIGPGQEYSPDCETLLRDYRPLYHEPYRPIPYGYHMCVPGRYPQAFHYDVSGYYYNMFCRLPSLRVKAVTRKQIVWDTMTGEELSRWYAVKDVVRSVKPLRNSLAGVAAGSVRSRLERPRMGYARDGAGGCKCFALSNRPGPFRSVGLLMVRSGVELTSAEVSQQRSAGVYSNVDCVITTEPTECRVWQAHGFDVKASVWHGDAEICHRGSWGIGTRQTEPYRGVLDPKTGLYIHQSREYTAVAATGYPLVYAPLWL